MQLGAEKVLRVPSATSGVATEHWSLDRFTSRLQISVQRLSDNSIEFDLVGVDASFANAVRRTLIAEVPTVAIEHVYVWNNTSIVQDEVLAQRLGLIPLAIDPRMLDFRQKHDDEPNDMNTVVFNLIANNQRRRDGKTSGSNRDVWSSDLEFDAKGSQAEMFAERMPGPASDNILLARLREGQEIIAELHCVKGKGKEHAKWSPVATASYRLLPTIEITDTIQPEDYDLFKACFAPGVIEEVDGELRVAAPRLDTVSREVLRHPQFQDKVSLGRKPDHFIFSVESAGQYQARDLPRESLHVLLQKVRDIRASAGA